MGWLGYGGNLPWRKQEYGVEQVLGVPISQGSLAQMQRYFKVCFGPIYQQWLTYVQQPGVRCVDELPLAVVPNSSSYQEKTLKVFSVAIVDRAYNPRVSSQTEMFDPPRTGL